MSEKSSKLPLWSNHYTCFFFNDTATTEIYTLSLHDALPISTIRQTDGAPMVFYSSTSGDLFELTIRSEEHTSELQSPCNLVCRLLLEKNKNNFGSPSSRTLRWRESAPRVPSLYLISTRMMLN